MSSDPEPGAVSHAPVPQAISDVVAKCEEYADELFSGEEYFTQITKWQDGDFRVLVHHGMGHKQEPYRRRAEKITYRHFDGMIVYSDETQMIDHHSDETHESEKLERHSDPVDNGW